MALAKFDFKHNQSKVNDRTGYFNISTTYEDGNKQVRNKGRKPRRWKLTFEKTNLDTNKALQIRQFFENRKGSYEPFLWDWKKEDGTVQEIEVRFVEDELNRSIEWYLKYGFSLTIEEVI
ncbi:MAG: hypothetical protein AWU54_1716 [Candidatus Frackibacter sp. T328-2]|nr:MAG: hypothetical protein AWU54_1716 [Candidatus Frackibacter sp. T328-2]